jgi:hypothetical protein
MRIGLLCLLWCLPWTAFAQSPEEDEKRIEEIVRERYGPTQAEIDELAAQGLGPDGQPLIDPATGLPLEPGMVLTPVTEPAPTEPAPAPAEVPAEPVVELPPIGPIQFEDLEKLVGQWVKVKTYNGRVWQGEVKVVKGNEVQLNVTQRGGAALMTLKKNAIMSLERI